ncbi:MAG: Nramp family divalent metal transporter, partial [Pirellulales bacterium]
MADRPAVGSQSFVAPHPGSKAMPRWNTAELIDAPRFTWRNWAAMIGPGLLMGGAAIGGGEWLTGPLVTARYGGNMLWLATLSIVFQVIYNLEICRYTLYTGEPIFTGKFRTPPGPAFWLLAYIALDFGALFPYLAASAATPVAMLLLGELPDPKSTELVSVLGLEMTQKTLLKVLGNAIFLLALVPLIFGGKIYNSLRAVMSFKIVTVFGFLLLLGALYTGVETWVEITTGFFKFGNVPVTRGEDANGNGRLDPGEDWDGDGRLDAVEPREDTDGNGYPWNPGEYVDLDGDGTYDGDNIDNIFLSLAEGRGFPLINFSMIGLLCAMVAISGQGGLSNTPLSNYTRDQGWGMGHHVGAIPSVVGGHRIKLSHVGSVFEVTADSLPRWRRWYRHVMRDQLVIWMPACFIGLALPSILSVQFLQRGTEASTWTAAGMTAEKVHEHVASASGPMIGNFFWFMTVFCG